MYKHPMLTVKEAAAALGCDERWIREKLNNGQLKGEKKMIGMKEKWFVFKGEIDKAIARKNLPGSVEQTNALPSFSVEQAQTNFAGYSEAAPVQRIGNYSAPVPLPAQMAAPFGVAHTGDPMPISAVRVVDEADSDKEQAADDEIDQESRRLELIAEKLIRPLTEQLQVRDKELQQASYRLGYLEGKMEDQEKQIKLLPDYQARAEEAERLKFESEEAKQRADELEKVAEIRKLELEALKKQIAALEAAQVKTIEEERSAAANAKKQAADLADEIEAVKAKNEAEAKSAQEKVVELTKKLHDLEKPWWKKLFAPSEN